MKCWAGAEVKEEAKLEVHCGHVIEELALADVVQSMRGFDFNHDTLLDEHVGAMNPNELSVKEHLDAKLTENQSRGRCRPRRRLPQSSYSEPLPRSPVCGGIVLTGVIRVHSNNS